MTARRALSLAASAGLTGGIFLWLFAEVSPREIVDLLREADPRGVLGFAVLAIAMNVFRTWRYSLLLSVSGHAPGGFALFLVVLVRNFFADLLPGRVGSLVYLWLLKTRLGVPLAPAASSFAASFVYDTLALGILLVLAGVAGRTGPGTARTVLIALGTAFALGSWLALRGCGTLLRRLAAPASRTACGLRQRLSEGLEALRDEVARLDRAGLGGRLLALSFLVRLAKYGALYVFLFGLLAPRGYGRAELEPARVLLALLAAEGAASLPVSGLGGFGAYEGAWTAAFRVLGFPADLAAATSVAHHAFTQAWGASLGAAAFALLQVPAWRQSRPVRSRRENGLVFLGKISVTSAAVAAALWLVAELPSAAVAGPAAPEAEPEANRLLRREIGGRLGGSIVFDSNRGGTFGIWSIPSTGGMPRVLVDGPEHEMFPAVSPDGRWIAFARAKSPRRGAPSEVWIVGRDGGQARRLAADGTYPTFSRDGRTLYFERGRRSVVALDLEGGATREVFPPGRFGFEGYEIVKPRVSAGGRHVVFTSDRGGRWNAWGVDLELGEAFHVGRGCEPAFLPNGAIAWVKAEGTLERSGIYVRDGGRERPLQDAGPPRGHEYFPTITPNGRFLLYAASRPGEHSHESANYQLFVKDLVTGDVARLTFDGFTNRWPKWLPPAAGEPRAAREH